MDISAQPIADNSSNPLPGSVSSQPGLVRAAHEFEAAMMKELLAPMTGNDSEEDGSGSALTSFAGEALGKAISEQGGFGIASRIIGQLGHRSSTTPDKPGSGPHHR